MQNSNPNILSTIDICSQKKFMQQENEHTCNSTVIIFEIKAFILLNGIFLMISYSVRPLVAYFINIYISNVLIICLYHLLHLEQ